MNPIVQLQQIGDQHTAAVRRIRDRFEQADQRAKEASRQLAVRERQQRHVDRRIQRPAKKPTTGALTPSDLLSHPELLVWALKK
ncbi:hypothetical protein [Nocardia sp. SSK8]|uniref:hypothetical protein n=1 Tax=Nocardia sp. SSK8 TaxID=3120154 RepID=UPI0030091822